MKNFIFLALTAIMFLPNFAVASNFQGVINKTEKRFLKCFRKVLESRKFEEQNIVSILQMRQAYVDQTTSIELLKTSCDTLLDTLSKNKKIRLIEIEDFIEDAVTDLSVTDEEKIFLQFATIPTYTCRHSVGFSASAAAIGGGTVGLDVAVCDGSFNGKTVFAVLPTLGIGLGLYAGVTIHSREYETFTPFTSLMAEDGIYIYNGLVFASEKFSDSLGMGWEYGDKRGYGIGLGTMGTFEVAAKINTGSHTNWNLFKERIVNPKSVYPWSNL